MTLKPYHEHELEPQDCSCCDTPAINWYCVICLCAIEGPPYAIGEYVVTSTWRYQRGTRFGLRLWRVYPLGAWKSECRGRNDGFVFESTRKRDALKHARELERGRQRLLRAIETGDAKMLADIHRDVKRVEREERDA